MTNQTCNNGPTVDTHSYSATMQTVERIMSECMYDGIPVDKASALAAAYSVPDGAPIWFAVQNVDIGTLPSDAACERHTGLRAVHERNVRAFRRGPRW